MKRHYPPLQQLPAPLTSTPVGRQHSEFPTHTPSPTPFSDGFAITRGSPSTLRNNQQLLNLPQSYIFEEVSFPQSPTWGKNGVEIAAQALASRVQDEILQHGGLNSTKETSVISSLASITPDATRKGGASIGESLPKQQDEHSAQSAAHRFPSLSYGGIQDLGQPTVISDNYRAKGSNQLRDGASGKSGSSSKPSIKQPEKRRSGALLPKPIYSDFLFQEDLGLQSKKRRNQ